MSIGVVIVTYNRQKQLKQCLESFEKQTFRPACIIVVDNCSTDGTKEFLDHWKTKPDEIQRIVYHEEENTGGSGGFYRGLQIAVRRRIDWIWVGDDDAVPEAHALEIADHYLRSDSVGLAALCAAVHTPKGIDVYHRRNIVQKGLSIKDQPVPEDRYNAESFECNAYSFVGSILSLKALEKAGLPKKDYFIWCDDTEHSIRMSRVGKIVCVPRIIVYHPAASDTDPVTWKEYYGARNKLGMIRDDFPRYCFVYKCIRKLIYIILLRVRGQKAMARIQWRALSDAVHNRYGKNAIYKPGWKPDSEA